MPKNVIDTSEEYIYSIVTTSGTIGKYDLSGNIVWGKTVELSEGETPTIDEVAITGSSELVGRAESDNAVFRIPLSEETSARWTAYYNATPISVASDGERVLTVIDGDPEVVMALSPEDGSRIWEKEATHYFDQMSENADGLTNVYSNCEICVLSTYIEGSMFKRVGDCPIIKIDSESGEYIDTLNNTEGGDLFHVGDDGHVYEVSSSYAYQFEKDSGEMTEINFDNYLSNYSSMQEDITAVHESICVDQHSNVYICFVDDDSNDSVGCFKVGGKTKFNKNVSATYKWPFLL